MRKTANLLSCILGCVIRFFDPSALLQYSVFIFGFNQLGQAVFIAHARSCRSYCTGTPLFCQWTIRAIYYTIRAL